MIIKMLGSPKISSPRWSSGRRSCLLARETVSEGDRVYQINTICHQLLTHQPCTVHLGASRGNELCQLVTPERH